MRLLILLSCLYLTACAINPVTGNRELSLLSESQEIQMGASNHDKILQQYGVYKDDKLQTYVSQLGQQLAQKSHRSKLNFTFTVLDSPVVNAFALPGGYVYITRGIMAYLNSEAELAGVLGHEIGHVTAKHGVQQYSQSQVAGVVGAVISTQFETPWAGDIYNLLGGALLRGYGRADELEADRLGAEYIAQAGYDPQEMLDVIGVLKDQEVFANQGQTAAPASYHALFATHPRNDQRLQEVISAAQRFKQPNPKPEGRDRYLNMIDGMIYGDNPDQGIVRNNRFIHTALNFAFQVPGDWQTINQADRVILVNNEQTAIVQMMLQSAQGRTTAAQALPSLMTNSRIVSSQPVSLLGFDAVAADVVVATENGQKQVRTLVAVRGSQIFHFVGYVQDDRQLSQYVGQFNQVMTSLGPVTNTDRKAAVAYRIDIVKAPASYDILARQSALGGVEPRVIDRLQLLNADYPNGKLTPGRRIKTVK